MSAIFQAPRALQSDEPEIFRNEILSRVIVPLDFQFALFQSDD